MREHGHVNESMLSVEEVLERILGFFEVLEPEEKPILDAVGQVLAEDVSGTFDVPPWDNSAMDGYAVQSSDISEASVDSPVELSVVGSVAAGHLPDKDVTTGTAVRIMTGAPTPEGADSVVPFEDTDESERKAGQGSLPKIGIRTPTAEGENIRPAGQDIRRGESVLAGGTLLGPAAAGVLASLGCTTVKVVRRPTVAIVATGDELLEPGTAPSVGKIFDTNSYSLSAAVAQAGGIPRKLGIARDDLDSLSAKLQEGLASDFLITSAGVSKGDYDMVKDVLSKHGEIDFWSVRMRPAKPLAFGTLKSQDGKHVPHLGLPGNPVSALVAFEQFGRRAIHKQMGRSPAPRPTIEAVLEEPIHNMDNRRVYARAVVSRRNGTYYARLTGHQSSNLLTSMARANGLAICPEDVPMKDAGEVVTVQMLDWPENVF